MRAILLIILSIYSSTLFSQNLKVQPLLIHPSESVEYNFPILICDSCKYHGEQVNVLISIDLVEFDLTDSIEVSERFNNDTTVNPIINLSYEVNVLNSRIYSVTFNAEGCGAYCEAFDKTYNYDFKKEDFIKLGDLFSNEGKTQLSMFLEDEKRKQLNEYFESKKDSISDPDEIKHSQLMEDMYGECYKNISFKEWTFDYVDFKLINNELFISSDRCSNHALLGLDSIGRFNYRINLLEWKNKLNNYGLSLISNN